MCLLSYIKFFDIRRDEEITFDTRGEAISLFCDTILSLPFEGYNGDLLFFCFDSSLILDSVPVLLTCHFFLSVAWLCDQSLLKQVIREDACEAIAAHIECLHKA